MADRGREAVYAAETAAFEGTTLEVVAPFDEMLELAALVTEAEWWPHGEIEVVPARADASTSSARQRGGGPPVIRLAAPQMTIATVLHELAHVLAGVPSGHGSAFRRAHVDLVGFAVGDAAAGWLLDAYDAMGLRPGERSWPAPPSRRGAADAPFAL